SDEENLAVDALGFVDLSSLMSFRGESETLLHDLSWRRMVLGLIPLRLNLASAHFPSPRRQSKSRDPELAVKAGASLFDSCAFPRRRGRAYPRGPVSKSSRTITGTASGSSG